MSAYALHILQNRHEFGPAEKKILKLLKPCNKVMKMNRWETLFMHIRHKHSLLISEQQTIDTNLLFDLAIIPHDLQNTP
jgi:hypothetical protein